MMSEPVDTSNSLQRIQLEDALKHLLECEEAGRGATVDSLAGSLRLRRRQAAEILGQLRGRQLARSEGDSHHLTADGRLYATQVVRTHRLYETWLARTTSLPPTEWHRKAHKAEHHIDRADADALANSLNNPRFDPHGDPIPTREGHLPKRDLSSLASWPDNKAARIEHIEDEPESLFATILSLGLAPSTILDELQHLPDGSLRARVEGRGIVIPAAVAPLIHVADPDPAELPADFQRLSDLPLGSEALVHSLSPSCTGAERSRLLDLGVVPGTRIRCEFDSPLGDPRSYGIRGALIALRRSQADRILMSLPDKAPSP